jgi:hypothetical protein
VLKSTIPTFPHPGNRLLFALFLVAVGCNKKTDDAPPTGEPASAEAPAADSDAGSAAAVASGLPSADIDVAQFERGPVLGHFAIWNLSSFIDDVRNHLVPPQMAGFVSAELARTQLGAFLGDRAALAENLVFDKPMGCALVDAKEVEFAVACVVAYKGGAAQAIKDMGTTGVQADASGHAGRFHFEGKDWFVDAMGDLVALSLGPDSFSTAKPYLERNVVGRSGKAKGDFEFIAFPGAIISRYEAEIRGMMKEMAKGADSKMARYQHQSWEDSIETYKHMDQITMALGVDARGAAFEMVQIPHAGSPMAALMVAYAPIDPAIYKMIPKDSFAVMGMNMDWSRVWGMSTSKRSMAALGEAIAELTELPVKDLERRLDEFKNIVAEYYGTNSAFGLVHIAGTPGAVIVAADLKKSGRDAWKAWSKTFTVQSVLGKKAAADVQWSFTSDAETVDGIAVDRWVIEPTPKKKTELMAELGDKKQHWESIGGGYALTIDRAEVDSHAIFVLAPGATTPYLQASIAAAKGGQSITSHTGFSAITGYASAPMSVGGLDVRGGAQWLRAVLPADEAAKIPASLGTDLTDVFLNGRSLEGGKSVVTFGVRQAFIDQVRGLAGQ